MKNNFQVNTVYSDLLSKLHYQRESLFTNQKSKKSKTLCYHWQHSVKSIIIQLKHYKSY